MARIRTIKPSFFTSLTIAQLARDARLTFAGLWTYCDDAGRGVDEPKLIKSALWPLDDDVTAADVAGHIDAAERAGLVVRYEVAGRKYLAVRNFREHQTINKPQPSKLPAPPSALMPTPPTDDSRTVPAADAAPLPERSGTATGTVTESYRGERKGREGNGREGEGKGSGLSTSTPPLAVARASERETPTVPPRIRTPPPASPPARPRAVVPRPLAHLTAQQLSTRDDFLALGEKAARLAERKNAKAAAGGADA